MARQKVNKYPCKDLYTALLEKHIGLEAFAELPFHDTRKWRFDYAIPAAKVAIEIDGGVFTHGRHSRGIGQVKDFEKMNAAAEEGWIVLHYIPTQKMKMDTILQIKSTINNRLLNEGEL